MGYYWAMHKSLGYFLRGALLLGGCLAAMSQISREEAVSNIYTYLDWIPLDWVETAFNNRVADDWALFIGLLTLLLAAVALSYRKYKPRPAVRSGAPEMPSVRGSRSEDFKHYHGQGNSIEVRVAGEVVRVECMLHIDHNSRSKFFSLYVPQTPHLVEVIKALVGSIPSALQELGEGGGVGNPGDRSMSWNKDAIFSGVVWVYHEGDLDDIQLGNLSKLYQSSGYRLTLRGRDYATVKWLQKKAG